jgi:hypothetical protein
MEKISTSRMMYLGMRRTVVNDICLRAWSCTTLYGEHGEEDSGGKEFERGEHLLCVSVFVVAV